MRNSADTQISIVFKMEAFINNTIGASTDYNEIARLREKLRKDFPQAFVIALKGGKRIDTNQAISEFLKNKK